jgi:CHAT domain-containing protein
MVSDKREVYEQLMSVLLRAGQVEEAFSVSDAARGRVLLERLPAAGGVGPAGADHAGVFSEGELLLSRIDRLVESIDYLEDWPEELTPEQSRELSSLYSRLTRARREYEGLLVLAAETASDEAALLGGARADVAGIRDALGRGQLLVEYFVPLQGPVVVFAVSRDEVRALETPIVATNLASRVRLVRDLIARPSGADSRLDRLLEGLHVALLEPLLNAGLLSEVEELVVVPHRELVYLPFAALRENTTGRYLVQDHALRVLPSAATLPVLAKRAATAGDGLRGSAFAPFPDQLPASRLEVDAVASEIGDMERLVGARATERAVRQALAEPGLVHLATHGILNVGNPMFSRLELARDGGEDTGDDGRLEVHELLGLTIEAPLVYLSGCETGSGAAHSTSFAVGADYATLAQAFLFAGASSVVATLWPVEDAGAAEFASRFYRSLEAGSSALALAEAQRAMLGSERYSSPYFWAGFQLAGDPGRGTAHMRAGSSVSSGERRNQNPVR